VRVLARGTEQRLVDLEQLQLSAAIERLSPEQSLAVLMLEFLIHDQPGGAVMSQGECAAWLRRGMPPTGLPRRLRPVLERAHDMARRFTATIEAGAHVDDDHELVEWCCWLYSRWEQDGLHHWDD
jgi:hypothetical protein